MTLREFMSMVLDSKVNLEADFEEIVEDMLTEMWKERKSKCRYAVKNA